MKVNIQLPEKIGHIFQPKVHPVSGKRIRYRGAHGGRGSGKTIGFADMALIEMLTQPMKFLFCRELQNSIRDSVHGVLAAQAEEMGIHNYFDIGREYFRTKDGYSEGIFKGLRSNIAEIKGMHGIKRAWVEEAQGVSQLSLDYLLPTIREENSEIWFTWNPEDELDPVHDMLAINTPDNAIVEEVNYPDNPFFPAVLEEERQRTLKFQPQRYDWIWLGKFNTNTDGAVYAKWVNEAENDGRIKIGIYDPELPVHTAWDLGYSDDTAIWFFQVAGNEVRLIGYYENNREGVKHYAEQILGYEIDDIVYGADGKVTKFRLGKRINDRADYTYGEHYVPHDAANKLLQAGGRSTVDQLFEFGIKAKVVAATTQQNQIDAARSLLQFTWIDPEACKEGLRCLRKYQFLKDEKRNKYLDKPDHDSYSHGCDAFEIIAQVWKSPRVTPEKAKPKFLHEMTVNDIFWSENTSSPGYDGRI